MLLGERGLNTEIDWVKNDGWGKNEGGKGREK